MKLTKLVLAGAMFALLGVTVAEASGGKDGWISDFDKAKETAKKKNIPIFAYFTGSDWCGWCVKLKAEVLHQDHFKKYAKDSLVLLELDFPKRKSLPAATKKQNDELKIKYEVRGFPSVLLLDAEGNVIGRTGYKKGGPEAYVESLREMIKKAAGAKEDAKAEKPAEGKQ